MPTALTSTEELEQQLWTDEEFLEWLKPGVHADLIDGEKFLHAPVYFKHAKLLNFLDHLLRSHLETKRLGELYREVVAVRLGTRNVFLPDLCFFTNDQVKQLAASHAPFAPTLVVEALSPRTFHLDTGPKFAAYEEHGVQELWILDPDSLAHRFYRREGELLLEFAKGEAKVAAQTIPGFWLKRDWLNPENIPAVADCLAEILRGGTERPELHGGRPIALDLARTGEEVWISTGVGKRGMKSPRGGL